MSTTPEEAARWIRARLDVTHYDAPVQHAHKHVNGERRHFVGHEAFDSTSRDPAYLRQWLHTMAEQDRKRGQTGTADALARMAQDLGAP